MKKLTILAILLFSYPAISAQWCEWDGSKGTNCQSDTKGYIVINGFKIRTPAVAHKKGYYKLTVTQPVVNDDKVQDAEVWELNGNQMSLTWLVRNMTQAEIDARDSEAMPLSEYYLWRVLITKGVITQQEAATYLPEELKDAYLARDRIENP